jgi:hypothetical protein
MIMGDGAPFILVLFKIIGRKIRKGQIPPTSFGAIGMSYGEDKLIGPPNWKSDPKSMKGAVISAVLGDGDWLQQ